MTTFQYFKRNCEGLMGLDTDKNDWPATHDEAKRHAAECLKCSPTCAIHLIANMKTHEEFMLAIKNGIIRPEVPESEI